jgi:hypothetical protein
VYNPWLYRPLPECVIVAFGQKSPLLSPSPLEFSEWLNFTRTPPELIWSSLVNITFGVWDHIPRDLKKIVEKKMIIFMLATSIKFFKRKANLDCQAIYRLRSVLCNYLNFQRTIDPSFFIFQN